MAFFNSLKRIDKSMSEEQKPSEHDPWKDNPQAPPKGQGEQWEKELITKLTMGALTEQRRARRWGVFFKLFMVAYVLVFLFAFMPDSDGGLGVGKDHTALIEIRGAIASDTEANADDIVAALRDAFDDKHTKGIILRINSPGGSPVQAGYVNDEIKRLRDLNPEIPVYAVVADMCASGGYYIAVAADEIYADKASMVGSIGVVMSSFGFVDTMEKLGVERRLLTAGESKGFLDPFSPSKSSDLAHVGTMLGGIHQQFIEIVKSGRGERLKDDPTLFTGLVWTGEQALELGLIDGLGSASYVAREVIGETNIVDYTYRPDPIQQFAEKLGLGAAKAGINLLGLDAARLQ